MVPTDKAPHQRGESLDSTVGLIGPGLSIRYHECLFPQERKASRLLGGFSRIIQARTTGGGISNESDLHRQQQYVKVLREVTAGDTLGPPENDDTNQAVRRFEMSGHLFSVALVDRMIAAGLLDSDGGRSVIITAEGQRFFTRHR